MRLHRKALHGGRSKRSGSARRADRSDAGPQRDPGVPVDAQLPAPEWPPRPVEADLASAEPNESALAWMRHHMVLDLAQAEALEAQAAQLRQRSADLIQYLDAHEIGTLDGGTL